MAIEDTADDSDICHPGYFHLLFVSSWVVDSADRQKEIRVAFHLPSGTTKKDLSIHVGPLQQTLNIYFSWPKLLTDFNVLHKYCLYRRSYQKDHI